MKLAQQQETLVETLEKGSLQQFLEVLSQHVCRLSLGHKLEARLEATVLVQNPYADILDHTAD